MRLVGAAVAGGLSRRMGRDKAMLPWEGGTLLGHTLARLRRVCPEVVILCGPTPRYQEEGVSVLADLGPDLGPLGGLQAALHAFPGEAVLLLGVDLPFAEVALLRRLAEGLAHADAVVPATAEGPHPLCAAYGPACTGPVDARLAAGERRMSCFWPDVRLHTLDPETLAGLGDPGRLLANLNTPEDYAAARRET